ncbi:hypothetical protein [Paraburkholderia bonniea]|uniref:hypothetical protein n=1 Tax=Paraburkholderia bonniea TaxID=2152891 RepID=UPI001292AE1A|nr:hypothetical protein [Paraburkholderia bonniea]
MKIDKKDALYKSPQMDRPVGEQESSIIQQAEPPAARAQNVQPVSDTKLILNPELGSVLKERLFYHYAALAPELRYQLHFVSKSTNELMKRRAIDYGDTFINSAQELQTLHTNSHWSARRHITLSGEGFSVDDMYLLPRDLESLNMRELVSSGDEDKQKLELVIAALKRCPGLEKIVLPRFVPGDEKSEWQTLSLPETLSAFEADARYFSLNFTVLDKCAKLNELVWLNSRGANIEKLKKFARLEKLNLCSIDVARGEKLDLDKLKALGCLNILELDLINCAFGNRDVLNILPTFWPKLQTLGIGLLPENESSMTNFLGHENLQFFKELTTLKLRYINYMDNDISEYTPKVVNLELQDGRMGTFCFDKKSQLRSLDLSGFDHKYLRFSALISDLKEYKKTLQKLKMNWEKFSPEEIGKIKKELEGSACVCVGLS